MGDNIEHKFLIVGASGFGREVLSCLKDCLSEEGVRIQDVARFLETKEFQEKTKNVHGIPVLVQEQFEVSDYGVVVGVGDPETRRRIVEKLPSDTKYTRIIHPSAVISDYVKIGEGSIVTACSIVTTDIVIGKHAHLNLHTTVGHDCIIGDYFTSAPGARISGCCQIGNSVYVGSNAAIRQDVKICDNVVIGMGAVVVSDIDKPGVYVGNPAKWLKGYSS